MKWINKIKIFFTFSVSEMKGIIVLIILIIITSAVPYLYKILFPEPPISEEWKKEMTFFEDSVTLIKDSLHHSRNEKKLFPFDLNTTSHNDLRKLGFSELVINNIISYRSKNGIFYRKEDLKKIYGVDSAFYNKIEPYITNREPRNASFQQNKTRGEIKCIELNSADSLEILSINGIGPTWTKRIIKFRNSLGGFHSLEQLSELYHMNDSILNILKKHCKTDSFRIKKMKVNSLSATELCSHPYISKYQANGILQYRKLKGNFKNNQDFLQSRIFPDSTGQKITPYLDYN